MENDVSSLCNYFLNVCQSKFVSSLCICPSTLNLWCVYYYIYTALCIFTLLYNEFLMGNRYQLIVSLMYFFSYLGFKKKKLGAGKIFFFF